MQNIFHILIDVLDTDDLETLRKYMQHYTNSEQGIFQIDALLQDQRVWFSLVFGELWKEVLGVYPPLPIAKSFLTTCNLSIANNTMTNNFNLHHFQAFVQALVPFWADAANALAIKLNVVKASFNATYLLARKLSYRYGIFPPQDNLSTLISSGGLNRGSAVSGLLSIANILGVEVPNRFGSLHALYTAHVQCIKAMDISNRNPFNGLTRRLDPTISFRSVFDALAYCFIEPSVVLMIVGAHALTCTKGNINVVNVIKTITECIPNNKLIFIAPHQQAATLNHIPVVHPIILNYMPKLAMTHLNVGLRHLSTKLSSQPPSSLTKITKRHLNNVSLDMCYEKMWLPLGYDDTIIEAILIVFCRNLMSYTVDIHALAFHQFLMRYYAKHRDAILARFKPKTGMRNSVLLIDSRDNILSVMSILLTFYNLSPGTWSLTIVCNESNVNFYKSHLGVFEHIEFVTQFNMPARGFNIDMYNDMLKSVTFWEYMSARYDKVLLIQDDGMLIRRGLEDTYFFQSCKYIGAPWCPNRPENKPLVELTSSRMVGNGGLSFRDTRTMLNVCKQHRHKNRELHFNKLQQEPEDVFFARNCDSRDIGSFQEATSFSTEQIINHKSFGFHKFWPYHNLEDVCHFFNDLLGDSYAMDANSFKLENNEEGEC
jgi:hypothetical protein